MLPSSIELWLLFLCFPALFAMICPPETGAVFFVDRLSDKNDHCFENCARTNCTGVIVSSTTCMTIIADNYYGALNEKDFVRKHCVQDISDFLVISQRTDRLLLDYTVKIEQTVDQFHCLSLCSKETSFNCLSAMFYNESRDCLLNSANSDTVALTPDTEGFSVSLMERRLPKPSTCNLSFNLMTWNQKVLRGDARLYNISHLPECLKQCKNCDYVLFHEAYNECFVIKQDENGQILDFIDDEYQVIENLCSALIPCSSESSMYVANLGFTKSERQICLQSCMSSFSCSHAYIQPNRTCLILPQALDNQLATVERQCSGVEKMEADESVEGILFEELDRSCPSIKGSLRIKGIGLTHCFSLCLTHPTKSCQAISYYPESNTCHLLRKSSPKKSKTLGKKKCRHFSLNIISLNFNDTDTARRSEGFSLDEPKVRAHSSKTFKKTKKLDKINDLTKKNIEIKTICKYDQIIIKLQSDSNLDGNFFARNAFDTCSVSLNNTSTAELSFNLTNPDQCGLTKKNHLYQAVVVIKENLSEESSLPIITETDRMYAISCDYGNGTQTTSASRQLSLKSSKYNNMEISGKVPYQSKMTMELRAKREHSDAKMKTVTLGQQLELVFHKDANIAGDYVVSECIATSIMSDSDNLTLIEDGCPTRSTKEYIIPGDIRRNSDGFTLPLRAFRFQNGDAVRIACSLKLCKTNCEQPTCRGRTRRNLSLGHSENVEKVLVTMRVQDEQALVQSKKDEVCTSTTRFYSILSACSIFLAIQLGIIIYFLIRKL